MTEVKEMTASEEIIAMLEQALAAVDASVEAPPAPYDNPIRREQDEYDYVPPGYDPDADGEAEDDDAIVDHCLDEIDAVYNADPDAPADTERGETEALLDATVTGDRVEWSFNCQYMLEAIDAYRKKAERIVIDTNGPGNPAVIRPEHQPMPSIDDSHSLTVIMPMSE